MTTLYPQEVCSLLTQCLLLWRLWEWHCQVGKARHSNCKSFSCFLLPLGTASGPAVTRDNEVTSQKREDCQRTVEQVFALLDSKTHTREIMTKKVRRCPPNLIVKKVI